MAQQIGEDTKVTIDLKTIGMAAAGIGTIVAMWFTLQSDIAEAKELPAPPWLVGPVLSPWDLSIVIFSVQFFWSCSAQT